MKLELKHLAPYLPYGLKCYHKDEIKEIVGLREWIGWKYLTKDNTGETMSSISVCKPLLRPLSDLVNFMDEYDQVFYPNARMLKAPYHQISLRIEILSDINTRSHAETEWLAYNHFDIFGLIDAVLALNKLDYER